MYTDETGSIVITGTMIAVLGISALISGGFGALSAAINGENVLAGFVIGFASSLIVGVAGWAFSGATLIIINVGVNMVSEWVSQKWNGQSTNLASIVLSGGFAVASGFINVKIDNWVDEMCLDTFTEIAWGVISETAFDSIAMGFDFINDKIANVYLVEVH